MEIRYELALKQFYDKMKVRMEDHVTKEELDERLYEKLHKREFEKHFERLNSTASTLETRVVNAIPAMKYDLETGLKGKADQREVEKMKTEKAGMELVLKLVARINSLEEKVALRGGGARRSRSGSSSSNSARSNSRGGRSQEGDVIHEDDDEDESDDGAPKKKKQSVTEKALKGSSSQEAIKDKNKGGLTAIEEDAEASQKSENSPALKTPGKKEEPDQISKGSGGASGAKLSNLNLLATGAGGGAVDQQFKDDINRKL